MRVNKPGIADLTLIDLPGITRNPVDGQPKDIERRIKDMISHYIKGDSKVILCVLPADQDFSTCEVGTGPLSNFSTLRCVHTNQCFAVSWLVQYDDTSIIT